jgi:phenylalanyl-tRNA synthetase alpha subunit
MFKLKESIEPNERENVLNKVKENFESLKNKISEIRFFEVGINISESPVAFDYIINSEFDNIDDLKTYSKHPAHIKAVEFNRQYSDSRIVVDYKI